MGKSNIRQPEDDDGKIRVLSQKNYTLLIEMPRKRKYAFQSIEWIEESPIRYTQTTLTSFFNCSKLSLQETKNQRKSLFENMLSSESSVGKASKTNSFSNNLPYPINDSEEDDSNSEETESIMFEETVTCGQLSKKLPYPISDSEDEFEEISTNRSSSKKEISLCNRILPDATSTPMKNVNNADESISRSDSSNSTIIVDRSTLNITSSPIKVLENICISPLKEISLQEKGNKRQNEVDKSIENKFKKQKTFNLEDKINMNLEINVTLEKNRNNKTNGQNGIINRSSGTNNIISNKPTHSSGTKKLTTKTKDNTENVNRSELLASSSNKISRKSPKSPDKKTINKKEDQCEDLNFNRLNYLKELFKNTVDSEYSENLLMEDEVQVVKEFLEMDVYHQYFLKKLFLHLPKWYNMIKFCGRIKLNEKLTDKKIVEMYKFFEAKNYIDTDIKKLETDELLNMLQLNDLQRIHSDFKLSKLKTKNKSTIIEALKKNLKTQTTLSLTKTSSEILKSQSVKYLGWCMKFNECKRRIFFKVYLSQVYPNPSYYDMRKYLDDRTYWNCVYPEYKVENYRPFSRKEEFSCFFEAISLKEDYRGALEENDSVKMKNCCDIAFEKLGCITNEGKWSRHSSSFLHKFSAEYQYISMLTSGSQRLIKFHEAIKKWLEFLIKHYPSHYAIGVWYKQLCHILIQYVKDYEKAAEKIVEAFEVNKKHNIFNIIQKFELSFLSNKLRRTKTFKLSALNSDMLASLLDYVIDGDHFPKKCIKGQTDRSGKPGRRTYSFIDLNGESNYGNVELLVLNHYKKEENYEGVHCEGRLVNMLFILLFWDIIYIYDVPNVFISNIQSAPLDMFSTCFYENRKDVINERLKDIAENWQQDKIEKVLKDNWDKHSHEESVIRIHSHRESTNKGSSPLENFREVLKMFRCINRQVLADIFERLAKNYRNFHSGLPDLFLWNVDASKCKFVEVKGENDKLSTTQILWIQYLLDIKADVEVCHVNGVGAKKIKESSKLKA